MHLNACHPRTLATTGCLVSGIIQRCFFRHVVIRVLGWSADGTTRCYGGDLPLLQDAVSVQNRCDFLPDGLRLEAFLLSLVESACGKQQLRPCHA